MKEGIPKEKKKETNRRHTRVGNRTKKLRVATLDLLRWKPVSAASTARKKGVIRLSARQGKGESVQQKGRTSWKFQPVHDGRIFTFFRWEKKHGVKRREKKPTLPPQPGKDKKKPRHRKEKKRKGSGLNLRFVTKGGKGHLVSQEKRERRVKKERVPPLRP